MTDRVQRLRDAIAARELGGLLVSNAQNRRYLSGFTGSAGYLLITPSDAMIATDFRYYEQSATQAPAFRLVKMLGGFEAWVPELLAGLGGAKIGIESADMTVSVHGQLRKAIADLLEGDRVELVPTPNVVEGLRQLKEPDEIAALQRAVDLGDAAFTDVAERVEPGWTEKQVAWEIEKYIREHGGDGLSFDTIVAGRPWGAMPHAYPRDRQLEAGEGVVIDMGCDVNGYMSDLTRTIFLGKPDDQFKKIYDIVLTAQLTAEEMVKPGMTGGEKLAVMELIRRIRDEGVTVFLVEHDMRLVMGVSDHVVVLSGGRVIAEGPPEAVQADAEVIRAYLGTTHAEA